MPKLTNLKGSEVLPKKQFGIQSPKLDGTLYLNDMQRGHNQCVQSLDKIGVVGRLDKIKLAKLISETYKKWEKNKNEYAHYHINPYRLEPGPMYFAECIIKQQSSLIELELIKEDE